MFKKKLYSYHKYFNYDVFVCGAYATSEFYFINHENSEFNSKIFTNIPSTFNKDIVNINLDMYWTINLAIVGRRSSTLFMRLYKGNVTSINDEYITMDSEINIPYEIIGCRKINKYFSRCCLIFNNYKDAKDELLYLKMNFLSPTNGKGFLIGDWTSNWSD